MHIPFSKTLDDVFQGDRYILLKMGAGALVAAFLTGKVTLQDRTKGMTESLAVIMIIVAAVIGALVGLLLSMKDAVERWQSEGQSVSFPLRLLFGMGIVSLFVWIMISVVATIVLGALSVMPR